MQFYAHTKVEPDGSPAEKKDWEPLFSPDCSTLRGEPCRQCESLDSYHGHLNKVAYLAGEFAASMFQQASPEADAARHWGQLLGWWHDLGKFSPEWQQYLAAKVDPHADEVAGKVDHSTAGAQFSHENIPLFGTLISYLIAGHHAGLPDGIDASDSNLSKRLRKQVPSYCEHLPTEILNFQKDLPAIPFALKSSVSLGFLLRMLFSTLVDADFLATEAFMSPERKIARRRDQPTITAIDNAFSAHLKKLTSGAASTKVNQTRNQILDHCLAAAEKSPGLFSLTVPTGGGKTLSSLAFALKHARIHNLRRVIYVIPFTSIIEQNAAVFRKALASLGSDIVLEHHSSLDPDSAQESASNRLAAENWDARIIVTTNVQFFESLHANRTSRCRKLHRIARSVVILDEAQALPVEFIAPCLRALEELHTHYGTSIVLCTATQPAIHKNEDFKIGLDSPTEIIPDPTTLYKSLQRVSTKRLPGKIDNLTLVALLARRPQSLTIVNTRRHARELFDLLPNDGSRFHLSALMCPAHRRAILYVVKRRLRNGLPVRLISTQLIEAGVDIDLPVVFRSLAGLDSIAQAAGRCDREGKLTAALGRPGGQLFLFENSEYATPHFIQSATNSTTQVLAFEPKNPLSLDCIQNFFQRHYWDRRNSTDQKHILENLPKHLRSSGDLLNFQFKSTARDFQLIDDYSEPVLIPFGKKGRRLCDQLRNTFDPTAIRILSRKLQRYTVTIPKPQHTELIRTGILIPLYENRFYMLNSDPHYSSQYGLHPQPDLSFRAQTSIL